MYYPESNWSYPHVTTTLDEVFDDIVLPQTLASHKELESFTYYSLGTNDIKDEYSLVAIGFIEDTHVEVLYLNDVSNMVINSLDLLNFKREVTAIEN